MPRPAAPILAPARIPAHRDRRPSPERADPLGIRVLLAALWLFHWLPLSVQAACGRGLGRLGWHLVPGRRRIALRNLERVLFPSSDRRAKCPGTRSFPLVGRSLLERGRLWYGVAGASGVDPRRGRRRPGRAQRQGGDVARAALHGPRRRRRLGALSRRERASRSTSARATRCSTRRCAGAHALGHAEIFSRDEAGKACSGDPSRRRLLQPARHGLRHARCGLRSLFGVAAVTLLARRLAKALDMTSTGCWPDPAGGQGYRVRFEPPWTISRSDVRSRQRADEPLDRERDPAQPGPIPLGPPRFKTRPAGRAVAVRIIVHAAALHEDAGAGNVSSSSTRRARRSTSTRRTSCAGSPIVARASAPTRS